MGKGKPRHNPDKPAYKYGDRCPYYEEYCNGKAVMVAAVPVVVMKRK